MQKISPCKHFARMRVVLYVSEAKKQKKQQTRKEKGYVWIYSTCRNIDRQHSSRPRHWFCHCLCHRGLRKNPLTKKLVNKRIIIAKIARRIALRAILCLRKDQHIPVREIVLVTYAFIWVNSSHYYMIKNDTRSEASPSDSVSGPYQQVLFVLFMRQINRFFSTSILLWKYRQQFKTISQSLSTHMNRTRRI